MSANKFVPHQTAVQGAQLPAQIEPVKWAEQAFSWSGEVALSRFARIAQESMSGVPVQVDCRLYKDDYHGRVSWLDATLATTVAMTCQRCLEPVDVALATEVHLALVSDASHAAHLDEAADFVVLGEEQLVHGTDDAHSLDLIELLEDELLLCVPISPRHEACAHRHQPVVEAVPEPVKRDHPFDVLATLKGKLDA